jgi:hypothetical protein
VVYILCISASKGERKKIDKFDTRKKDKCSTPIPRSREEIDKNDQKL